MATTVAVHGARIHTHTHMFTLVYQYYDQTLVHIIQYTRIVYGYIVPGATIRGCDSATAISFSARRLR